MNLKNIHPAVYIGTVAVFVVQFWNQWGAAISLQLTDHQKAVATAIIALCALCAPNKIKHDPVDSAAVNP